MIICTCYILVLHRSLVAIGFRSHGLRSLTGLIGRVSSIASTHCCRHSGRDTIFIAVVGLLLKEFVGILLSSLFRWIW
jgi:hypothetical protein